jgi:hypothetical protein
MVKNYYSVLGVLPSATLEEIRSAYRSRAKQYHPDRSGRDSAPFLNIQEAYDVLGDPANRSVYDQSLKETIPRRTPDATSDTVIIGSRKPAAEPLREPHRRMDLGTISPRTSFRTHHPSFDEIFDYLWNPSELRPAPKSEQHHTLTMEILVSRDQARRGGSVQVLIPIGSVCSTCDGYGYIGSFQCWNCGGDGVSVNEFPLQVEFPPGIQDFYQVAIPLDRLGIRDVCPVLRFRISHKSDFEDF